MKKCSICGQIKEDSCFAFQNKKEGKLVSACKDCYNKKQREFRMGVGNPTTSVVGSSIRYNCAYIEEFEKMQVKPKAELFPFYSAIFFWR